MAQDTQVNGDSTKRKAKDNFFTLTEILIMETGKKTKLTDTALISIKTGPSIRGIGRMIFSMGMAKSFGLMAVSTRENIAMVRKMAKESTYGLINLSMKACGATI